MVKQMAVFMENRKGRILHLTKVLRDNKIDLLSLSVADTKDFGILRCVVSDNDRAEQLLKSEGFAVTSTELLGVEVKDEPGGLAYILEIMEEADVNIEYIYSHAHKASASAFIFLKVAQEEKAQNLLKSKGIKLLNQNML